MYWKALDEVATLVVFPNGSSSRPGLGRPGYLHASRCEDPLVAGEFIPRHCLIPRISGIGRGPIRISQRRQVAVGVKRGALVPQRQLLIASIVGRRVQCGGNPLADKGAACGNPLPRFVVDESGRRGAPRKKPLKP